MHVGLVEEEYEALFIELDKNHDGDVDYTEFLTLFSKINAAQLIQRMRRVLYGARVSIETIYNEHTDSMYMTQVQFKQMISQLIGAKVAEFEVESIFRELDHNHTGKIPKDRFIDWFGHEEQEKLFQVGIEDIIKPLKTFMNKKVNDENKAKKSNSNTLSG